MRNLALAALVALLSGFGAGYAFSRSATPFEEETCVEGRFVVQSQAHGAVLVGDQSICGRGLHFTVVTGPSKSSGGIVH